MYLIREVLTCKPGKVRPMLEKFKALSRTLAGTGRPPLRLLTDVASEPFWTLIIEMQLERLDDFEAVEREAMSHDELRATFADYHDLVTSGRREIFRIEG